MNSIKEIKIKMHMRKILGLAVCASLVVMGLAASGAFAAGELKLVNGATYPQPFLSHSEKTSNLVSGENTVSCPTLLNKGLLNSPTDALILLLWHKCTTAKGIVTCQSTGEPSGLIHALVLALFGLLLTHVPGILFQADKATHIGEFECGGVPVLVNGTVNANITSPAVGTPSNLMLVNVEVETPGVAQKFKHLEGENSIDLLESSFAGGGFAMATEEVTEDDIHFTNAGIEAEFVG